MSYLHINFKAVFFNMLAQSMFVYFLGKRLYFKIFYDFIISPLFKSQSFFIGLIIVRSLSAWCKILLCTVAWS